MGREGRDRLKSTLARHYCFRRLRLPLVRRTEVWSFHVANQQLPDTTKAQATDVAELKTSATIDAHLAWFR